MGRYCVNRKLIHIVWLPILLSLLLQARFISAATVASDHPVHNLNTKLDYSGIQEAIDAPQTQDEHTIFIEEGTYYEHLDVHKSLSLQGENRSTIIDGGGTGIAIHVSTGNVTIKQLTVKNSKTGIYGNQSDGLLAIGNTLVDNDDALVVRNSGNCTIEDNEVANNSHRGILVTNSHDFIVKNNVVYSSGWYGINANTSANGLIARNRVHQNNFDGIGLFAGSNCVVAGNNISDNLSFGLSVDSLSHNNRVFHNNIIDNGIQAVVSAGNALSNGVEGNYWSDYNGADLDHDGIGDTSHFIDQDVQDGYPLAGMFYSFSGSPGDRVNVISNSTVEALQYFEANRSIGISFSDPSSRLHGFCRVCIPRSLMNVDIVSVTIDDGLTAVLHPKYRLHNNGTHAWIYFAYRQPIHRIVIFEDTTPPRITVIAPGNRTYGERQISLNISVNENFSWVGYSLDGEENRTTGGNATLPELVAGSHSIVVYATDLAGNTGASEEIRFTIDVQQAELLPPWVAAIVILGIVGVGAVVYFTKVRKSGARPLL